MTVKELDEVSQYITSIRTSKYVLKFPTQPFTTSINIKNRDPLIKSGKHKRLPAVAAPTPKIEFHQRPSGVAAPIERKTKFSAAFLLESCDEKGLLHFPGNTEVEALWNSIPGEVEERKRQRKALVDGVPYPLGGA